MADFLRICRNTDLSLSILLVSNHIGHLKSITEDLQQLNLEHSDLLKVHTCESVAQVLKATEIPEIDYVAFFVNSNNSHCLREIEHNITLLDSKYLLNRICLICNSSLKYSSDTQEIINLKLKYQLHVLWGDLETESELVSSRLVKLVFAVCGVVSGFPIISHQSWHRKVHEHKETSDSTSEENSF